MSGPYQELEVRLQRDAFSTPWGFRLQGGKDFTIPLSVQRVFVGSPAQSELQRGDVMLKIENYDVTNMIHKQAQDIIRRAGGTLAMTIKRGPRPANVRPTVENPSAAAQFFRSRSLESGLCGPSGAPTGTLGFIPKPQPPQMAAPVKTQSYGVDYTRPGSAATASPPYNQQNYGTPQRGPTYPSSMLNRLNASLTANLWTPSDYAYNGTSLGGSEDNYDRYQRPHSQQDFYEPGTYTMPVPSMPAPSQSPGRQRRIWTRPDGVAGLTDPGWDPRMAQQQHRVQSKGWKPASAPRHGVEHGPPPPPPVNARRMQPPAPSGVPQLHYEMPAWKGTLKSSGAPRRWDAQAAVGRPYSPSGADGYPASQHSPATVQPHKPALQKMTYTTDGGQVYSQDSNPAPDSSDSAKVMHLQYNSPIGLYSRSNVDDALSSQTAGMPGEGTMQVTGGGSINLNGSVTPHNAMAQKDFTCSELAQLVHHQDVSTRRSASPYECHRPAPSYECHPSLLCLPDDARRPAPSPPNTLYVPEARRPSPSPTNMLYVPDNARRRAPSPSNILYVPDDTRRPAPGHPALLGVDDDARHGGRQSPSMLALEWNMIQKQEEERKQQANMGSSDF